MADYSYTDLKHKTVAELREIAKGLQHEAVQGATQMNKEHLLTAVCKALNIPTRILHVASGVDKKVLKGKIRGLQTKRDELLQAGDHSKLSIVRRKIHRLKHALRKAAI